MSRAVFIDRDGVINRKAPEGKYITRWDEVVFLPGVMEAVRRLNRAGFLVIVATNQRAVAKKLLTLEGLEGIHRRIAEKLAQSGALIDAFYYCPHDPSEKCECRKPRPGMLLRAAGEHGIDLTTSWVIGDKPSDIEAGHAAGCRTVWIAPPECGDGDPPIADFAVGSLWEAAVEILRSSQKTATNLSEVSGT